jgi:hypothetical protein
VIAQLQVAAIRWLRIANRNTGARGDGKWRLSDGHNAHTFASHVEPSARATMQQKEIGGRCETAA